MLNGFGLERIGLAALRLPVLASLVLMVVTLIALAGLPRLGFSGANVDILRDGSQELADYDELLDSFRNFNNDAIVLIRSDNLATVEGLETYRDMHFEFQFDDRVESVLSLYSLVQYDKSAGGWKSALPARYDDDGQVKALLDRLKTEIPNSQSLFSPTSAVIVLYAKPGAVQDASVTETMAHFTKIAKTFEKPGFTITLAGQPAIRADLISSIGGDLARLLPIAVLFCAIISFAIFRSPLPVLITGAAPVVSAAWMLGAMGLTGNDLNFLTAILPVLVIVVVFADALHLYMKWEAFMRERGPESRSAGDAIAETVRQVGPACILSAITTAAALFSLAFAGNHGLVQMGVIGGLAVLASLLAVLTITPLAIHWAVHIGHAPKAGAARDFAALSKPALGLLAHPARYVLASLVLLAAGLYAHVNVDSRFQLADYLASHSEIAEGERFIDEAYPGSTPLFVMVDLDPQKSMLDEANVQRFDAVLAAIGRVFPSSAFYSLADFRSEISKGGGEIREEDIDELPSYLTSRFISADRKKALITIFSSANLSASEMSALLDRLRSEIDETGQGADVTVTGFPVLSAVVAPRLMDNLRFSLLGTIVVSIVLIGFAARSWRLGLACLVPNLLPIVCVELILWATGTPLNLSVTVALTVAFGLAVNDSIHLTNQYMMERARKGPHEALSLALKHTLPAMASTTLILAGGLVITLFSALPVISLFSAVMILTLLFAILFDAFQLPVHILTLERRGDSQQ